MYAIRSYYETGGSIDLIQYLAQKYNADVYVEVSFTSTPSSSGGKFYATAQGSMKIYDTSTAQLLGSVAFQSPQVMSTVSSDAAVANAVAASVWSAMPKMTEQTKVLVKNSMSRGIRYEVVIQNTPDSRQISTLRRSLARVITSYSIHYTKLYDWRHRGVAIGFAICEDLWRETAPVPGMRYPVDPPRELLDAGADLIVVPSASPFQLDKSALRVGLCSDLARTGSVPVAYCNMAGADDSLVFDGRSFLVDRSGRLVALGGFGEGVLVVDTDETAGEAAIAAFPDRWEEAERVLVEGIRGRITSYNVCYTKLLRGIDRERGGRAGPRRRRRTRGRAGSRAWSRAGDGARLRRAGGGRRA